MPLLTVSGALSVREKIAIPPGGVATVKIVDADGEVLAATALEVEQVPLAFEVAIDPEVVSGDLFVWALLRTDVGAWGTLELVPADGDASACAPVVTIARWTGLGKDMTIGVDRGGDRWRRVVRTYGPGYTIPIVAVEVARDHLTWFVDGEPVGTVRDPRATPDVPMTLRMSLEGDEREHDNTSLFSDWQRSFDLGPGRQVTSGPELDRSARPGC